MEKKHKAESSLLKKRPLESTSLSSTV